jgi:hypothetical protein
VRPEASGSHSIRQATEVEVVDGKLRGRMRGGGNEGRGDETSIYHKTASSSACALAQGVNENAPVEETNEGDSLSFLFESLFDGNGTPYPSRHLESAYAGSHGPKVMRKPLENLGLGPSQPLIIQPTARHGVVARLLPGLAMHRPGPVVLPDDPWTKQ